MKNIRKALLLLLYSFLQLFCSLPAFAQPAQQFIDVQVAPTKLNWIYQLNEDADFEIRIIKNGQLLPNVTIRYEIGPEQLQATKSEEIFLKKGETIIKGNRLNEPGFLRCHVWVRFNGRTYEGWGTAGFAPEKIIPSVKMPPDFDTFWGKAKEELSKIPVDAIVTLKPELCTSEINVYHINLQNIKMPYSWLGVSRFYGMLSVPKKSGKYPAILEVPGAGVRAYGRDDRAAKGVIVLKVGIHGIPVDQKPEIYKSLATGVLSGYQNYHLENRDQYYYKRVYLGCVRAVDFIYSLPEFDGENLAVTGGSQGGALSIITAALDSRIKYLAVFYPALSDLTGYLKGRAGGWPHMYKNYNKKVNPNWINTTAYYDVVNFARRINIPGWYSWGFNDNVCPPTSMYASYNVIQAPKELHKFLETQHWTYPEQQEEVNKWIFKKIKE